MSSANTRRLHWWHQRINREPGIRNRLGLALSWVQSEASRQPETAVKTLIAEIATIAQRLNQGGDGQ